MRLRALAVIVPTIGLALLLAGCPKRPMVPVASAPPPVVPAPTPPPAPAAPTPPVVAAPIAPPDPAPGSAEGVHAQRCAQADQLCLRSGGDPAGRCQDARRQRGVAQGQSEPAGADRGAL